MYVESSQHTGTYSTYRALKVLLRPSGHAHAYMYIHQVAHWRGYILWYRYIPQPSGAMALRVRSAHCLLMEFVGSGASWQSDTANVNGSTTANLWQEVSMEHIKFFPIPAWVSHDHKSANIQILPAILWGEITFSFLSFFFIDCFFILYPRHILMAEADHSARGFSVGSMSGTSFTASFLFEKKVNILNRKDTSRRGKVLLGGIYPHSSQFSCWDYIQKCCTCFLLYRGQWIMLRFEDFAECRLQMNIVTTSIAKCWVRHSYMHMFQVYIINLDKSRNTIIRVYYYKIW